MKRKTYILFLYILLRYILYSIHIIDIIISLYLKFKEWYFQKLYCLVVKPRLNYNFLLTVE